MHIAEMLKCLFIKTQTGVFLGVNTRTPVVCCAASELRIDLRVHVFSSVLLTASKHKYTTAALNQAKTSQTLPTDLSFLIKN